MPGEIRVFQARHVVTMNASLPAATHIAVRETYAANPVQRRMGRDDLDIEVLHASGRRIPVDIQLTPVPGLAVTAVSIRDMTSERERAVAGAMQRLEMLETVRRNEHLVAYYDVMLQRLYALGTHLEVEAGRHPPELSRPFFRAAEAVDALLDHARDNLFGPY